MKKHKLAEGIYLLMFPSQYQLASTFLRLQEYYESPKYKGRIFSLEEFMDWYAKKHRNKFTYFTDWAGFNVPSTVFQTFYQGKFDPLLEKEKKLLQLFKDVAQPFYVIGIYKHSDFTHELAHALYFTNKHYNNDVKEAMAQYDTSSFARRVLSGYAKHVIPDEVQANLVAPGRLDQRFRALIPLQSQLRRLFKQYSREIHPPN
jgi:hypothetical protein